MALRPPPELTPETHETIWWGDDAVDREQSRPRLHHWCETGDTDGLVLVPGSDPSVISYRGLTTREVSQLPALDGSAASVMALAYEAARYGVVGVRGLPLARAQIRGVRGLTDAALDQLSALEADIPVMLAHYAWLRAMGVEMDDMPRDRAEELLRTDLAQWIGARVLALTFRARRGSA